MRFCIAGMCARSEAPKAGTLVHTLRAIFRLVLAPSLQFPGEDHRLLSGYSRVEIREPMSVCIRAVAESA